MTGAFYACRAAYFDARWIADYKDPETFLASRGGRSATTFHTIPTTNMSG
jgi:hypothetical protein